MYQACGTLITYTGGATSSIGGSASSTGRLSEGARTQSSGSQKECQSPHAETQGKAATSVNWMHVSELPDASMRTVFTQVIPRACPARHVAAEIAIPKHAWAPYTKPDAGLTNASVHTTSTHIVHRGDQMTHVCQNSHPKAYAGTLLYAPSCSSLSCNPPLPISDQHASFSDLEDPRGVYILGYRLTLRPVH